MEIILYKKRNQVIFGEQENPIIIKSRYKILRNLPDPIRGNHHHIL